MRTRTLALAVALTLPGMGILAAKSKPKNMPGARQAQKYKAPKFKGSKFKPQRSKAPHYKTPKAKHSNQF